MDSNLLRLIRFLVSFFRERPSTSRFYGVVKRILATVQPLLQVFDCLGAFLRLGRTEAARSKCPHNDQSLDQQEKPQGIIPQPSLTLVPNGEVITSHGAPCSIEPSVEGFSMLYSCHLNVSHMPFQVPVVPWTPAPCPRRLKSLSRRQIHYSCNQLERTSPTYIPKDRYGSSRRGTNGDHGIDYLASHFGDAVQGLMNGL